MGAWIEIQKVKPSEEEYIVAPLVGAWIEINIFHELVRPTCVAPLVGAWIEISAYEPIHNHNMLRYCRISS